MLLVFDVGNTNTVLGLYKDDSLVNHWRVGTDKDRTVDEYGILIHDLFRLCDIHFPDVSGVIISSVVPPMATVLEGFCRKYLDTTPFMVGPDIETGMEVRYDSPKDVGADRIVNAVAAYEKKRCSLIVVDFGTATTFDYISADGAYEGGVIAPGPGISAEALFSRASKLPRVGFTEPSRVIAKNTVDSMQAGLFYGYIGLVDGIVARMTKEADDTPYVMATGGLASLIAPASETIEEVDPSLTLEGLRLIYKLNC